MIEGYPYNKLIAVNGQKLSGARAAAEERKLQREIRRRRKESPAKRKKSVAEFQNERRQDHALLTEMVKAFEYRLTGQAIVGGHRCFVLQATPKPDYVPPNRDTEVLKGMRGEMWIDTSQYQWEKVHAEVFRSVHFGFFIASVKPGTEFTLEQQPAQGTLWLPSHFSKVIRARVLFSRRRIHDDETYSEYRPAAEDLSQQHERARLEGRVRASQLEVVP